MASQTKNVLLFFRTNRIGTCGMTCPSLNVNPKLHIIGAK